MPEHFLNLVNREKFRLQATDEFENDRVQYIKQTSYSDDEPDELRYVSFLYLHFVAQRKGQFKEDAFFLRTVCESVWGCVQIQKCDAFRNGPQLHQAVSKPNPVLDEVIKGLLEKSTL